MARRDSAFGLLGWEVFRWRGRDARSFLNGLLTNDVARLPEGGGFPICLLTPKGRLQACFFLYDTGETLTGLCPPECAPNLQAAMDKFLPLSETSLERPELEIALMKGRDDAGGLDAFPAPEFGLGAIFVAAESSEKMQDQLRSAGSRRLSAEELEAWRVESGWPRFGVDVDGETLVQEARLERAVSFTKGCYMGQETVSRVRHLGHVNRKLCGVALDGDAPARGADVLLDGKPVGKVTSACRSPTLRSALALAMLRVEAETAGAPVEVSGRSGRVVADLSCWRPAGT